jgi:hypothetical protein
MNQKILRILRAILILLVLTLIRKGAKKGGHPSFYHACRPGSHLSPGGDYGYARLQAGMEG